MRLRRAQWPSRSFAFERLEPGWQVQRPRARGGTRGLRVNFFARGSPRGWGPGRRRGLGCYGPAGALPVRCPGGGQNRIRRTAGAAGNDSRGSGGRGGHRVLLSGSPWSYKVSSAGEGVSVCIHHGCGVSGCGCLPRARCGGPGPGRAGRRRRPGAWPGGRRGTDQPATRPSLCCCFHGTYQDVGGHPCQPGRARDDQDRSLGHALGVHGTPHRGFRCFGPSSGST